VRYTAKLALLPLLTFSAGAEQAAFSEEFFHAFTKKHCISCHNLEKKKGKFVIEGLADIAGNRSDYWNPSYEPVEATDPQGPKSGFARADRGGGWDTYCRTCNATSRSGSTEAYAGSQTGFRLTRVP
jgi:hypothetical protein